MFRGRPAGFSRGFLSMVIIPKNRARNHKKKKGHFQDPLQAFENKKNTTNQKRGQNKFIRRQM